MISVVLRLERWAALLRPVWPWKVIMRPAITCSCWRQATANDGNGDGDEGGEAGDLDSSVGGGDMGRAGTSTACVASPPAFHAPGGAGWRAFGVMWHQSTTP
jgi:hypothetical protein